MVQTAHTYVCFIKIEFIKIKGPYIDAFPSFGIKTNGCKPGTDEKRRSNEEKRERWMINIVNRGGWHLKRRKFAQRRMTNPVDEQ